MTILLTTHLLDEAQKLCDRLGIIKQGQIINEGSLTELKRLVPAQEILLIKTDNQDKAIAIAQKYSFNHRYYGGELAFLLPKSLDLNEILQYFEGVTLSSITKQPVSLEHIYLEATR